MRILVVEDEEKVARFLTRGLREECFSVDVARDGEEALFLASSNSYDLIVLDVVLPKKDGFQVLRDLRASRERSRILMLTARDSVGDRVRGLDLGADDYLVKPFAFAEFLARVRALLRRDPLDPPSVLQVADVALNFKTRSVMRGGKEIVLTPKELGVLEYLMRRKGEVVTRTELAEHVWDENFDSFSNVIQFFHTHCKRSLIFTGIQINNHRHRMIFHF